MPKNCLKYKKHNKMESLTFIHKTLNYPKSILSTGQRTKSTGKINLNKKIHKKFMLHKINKKSPTLKLLKFI